MSKRLIEPPYLGAAYYPEAWPLEQVDEDIALMKKANMNVMRIAEFAWSRMEPEEHVYDFQWLHEVVDKLTAAGIGVIMCTPTNTPPVWLTEKYPEVLFTYEDGHQMQHGGRRHICLNNPTYRELCRKISEKMAEEFGRHEGIIGWQVDNEMCLLGEMERRLNRDGRGCCCHVCQTKFREWLKEKFSTIDALNQKWGTNIWSQSYQSFDQIPYPQTDTWHHTSLLSAWTDFHADSAIAYIENQVDVLHAHVTQPVGTDMLVSGRISYEKMHKKLDVVEMNHYTGMGKSRTAAFWMDLSRPIKDVPFWNTETSLCWLGGFEAKGFKGPGFGRINSWLPIAMGGEATVYWLWRTHWSGQELMHGSVVTSSGRPVYNFHEVVEVGEGFRSTAPFINHTRVLQSDIAIHFSSWARWMYEFQPVVQGFKYMEQLIERVYYPIAEAHLRTDVIDPRVNLDSYKVVCSPFLPALDEGDLRERLYAWICAGGTWIAGPLTDIRTSEAAKFIHSPFGSLEEWTGVHSEVEIPFANLGYSLQWSDGQTSKGAVSFTGFKPNGADVLAQYADGPLEGLAAIVSKKVGKGRVIILGTLPDPELLRKLLISISAEAGVPPVIEASRNVLYVPRAGDAGEGAVVIEVENKPGSLTLQHKMVDLLTGIEHEGVIDIQPYTVLVLKNV